MQVLSAHRQVPGLQASSAERLARTEVTRIRVTEDDMATVGDASVLFGGLSRYHAFTLPNAQITRFHVFSYH